MKRKSTLLMLSALALPVVTLLIGKWLAARQTRRAVSHLFTLTDIDPGQTYDPAQLVDLPTPVQRYFRHVLKPGQPYLRTARLRHDGQFKTDLNKDWIAITGEEYFLANKPGYLWMGHTRWFSACDQYVSGVGGLTVRLLDVLPVVLGSGPSFDQGELLRWLAETAWFPTSLLPSRAVTWSPVDAHSALVSLTDHDQTVSCLMGFNENDELVRCEAQRYSDATHIRTWVCHLADYRDWHGLRLPTRAGAAWVIDGEEKPYARFNLLAIEFDRSIPY